MYSSAQGQTTSYTYDGQGNTLTVIDPLNRLTGITFEGGVVHQFQYDQGQNGIGRLTGVIDLSSTLQYAYDAHGRLIRETRSIMGFLAAPRRKRRFIDES